MLKPTPVTTYLYLFILLFTCSCAATKPGNSQPPQQQSLLWEITGNGLKTPSYIYGTIHAICPDDFILTEPVKDRLQKSEQLSLEIDMDDPNFMMEIQKGALMSGPGLKSYYTEEQYQVLKNHFQSTMNINVALMDGMKPFIINSMLLLQLTECKPESYEQALMKLAQEQGKEVIGVETVQDQINSFDKVPYELQAKMLLESIEKMDESKANYKKMVQLYLAQDLTGLEKLIKEDYKGEHEAFEDALFTERNNKWIPTMKREAMSKSTFFAVGAGHLPGENGILDLLRKEGYTLTPIR